VPKYVTINQLNMQMGREDGEYNLPISKEFRFQKLYNLPFTVPPS
jgi:hypothetical protein